ncbi:hypothetical protein Droror1_Dr00014896 [Drosera rotundifolia]
MLQPNPRSPHNSVICEPGSFPILRINRSRPGGTRHRRRVGFRLLVDVDLSLRFFMTWVQKWLIVRVTIYSFNWVVDVKYNSSEERLIWADSDWRSMRSARAFF